jgi:hypothetical protein
MSVVFSRPENRLAWRAGRKGVSRAQAAERAKRNVEALRQPTIAYIDENLQRLSLLFAQTDGAATAPYTAFYDASDAIAGTAALFGLDALGRGAFGLCDLLAHLEDERTWNAPAVKIYLDGLSIMRQFQTASVSHESNLILENLALLLSHVTDRGDSFPGDVGGAAI